MGVEVRLESKMEFIHRYDHSGYSSSWYEATMWYHELGSQPRPDKDGCYKVILDARPGYSKTQRIHLVKSGNNQIRLVNGEQTKLTELREKRRDAMQQEL